MSSQQNKSTSQAKAQPIPLWKHFVAGNCGGIFGLALAYPLDTVKVRMQTRPQGTYTGIYNCLSTISRQEGFSALYRGLLSPVLGFGLINATVFGSNSFFRGEIRKSELWNGKQVDASEHDRSLTMGELAICGAAAGFTQSFVRAPIEQIKVVMQARNKPGSTAPPYKSTIHCAIDVVKTEGIRVGLYRSIIPTISREIPQYAIYYPVYETIRALFLQPGQDPTTLHWSYTVFAGGMAGVGQWLPTYSADVVKSRVAAAEPGTYNGLVDCARKIYRTEGGSAFFRGLSAALVRAFPLHGCIFLGYETTMVFLKDY